MAAACSAVAEDVEPKQIVSGTPALPHRQSLREQGALRHLPELRNHVRKLQEELDALKKQLAQTLRISAIREFVRAAVGRAEERRPEDAIAASALTEAEGEPAGRFHRDS